MSYETLLVPDRSRAIGTSVISLPVGALDDPIGQEGLAYLTSQMLLRGAGERDHGALMEAIDYLGSTLSAGVGRERTSLSGDALTRNRDAFQALVADVLRRPRFETQELDKLRRQTLAELAQVQDSDGAVGQRFFVRRLFQGHPYGRPLKGTARSLARIGIEDIRAFYAERYRCAGAVLAAAGDWDRARLDAYGAQTVGALPAGPATSRDLTTHVTPAGLHVTLVDKPERSQTQVFLGHVTVSASHPDYFPLLVAQTLFGGTFTARLSHEIREKRGWSYGAYSYLSTDRTLGTVTMRFYPAVADTVPAMRLCHTLYADLAAQGATEAEVVAAKSYLVNSHAFAVDTAERHLSELLSARLSGRPDDFVTTFAERISAVSTADVNRACRAHMTPGHLVGTVVATASDLIDELRAWDAVSDVAVVDYRAEIDAE